jgi:uncharacterized protein YgbK (DUF1537 family)
MLIGVIADDLTGATDVAVNLARAGLSVVQMNGVPESGAATAKADAIVIALKSRTIPADEAVALSLAAARWLKENGAERLYFKYCSTFDSTAQGNIGPVTEALLAFTESRIAVATPAYPRNQRTVYQGHLFVGKTLLSESSMKSHPLTPMTNSDLVSVLAMQSTESVGLIDWASVDAGSQAIRQRLIQLADEGHRHAILDATKDEHLIEAGHALLDQALTTGGSGLAMGLAVALSPRATGRQADASLDSSGPAIILAGSCSEATLQQVDTASHSLPAFMLDPLLLALGPEEVARAIRWAIALMETTSALLIYASAKPEAVAIAHRALGREQAAEIVESAFRKIAIALSDAGARTFVVAGGETSGAVVEALAIKGLAIGPEIAPGVPWTLAVGSKPYRIALKSGNFGQPDFFVRALDMLN